MESLLLGAALVDGVSDFIGNGCPEGFVEGWPLGVVLMDGKLDGIKEGGFI